MAFFLSGTEPTLPMYIWGQLRFPQQFPAILALSSIIIFVSFIIVLAGQYLNRDANETLLKGEKDS